MPTRLPPSKGRAELIRRAFLFTLLCLAGTGIACLLLGLGLYWQLAQVLAAIVIFAAILCLLLGTLHYIAEVMVALSSVREEAAFYRLMGKKELRAISQADEEPEEGWQEQKG